MENRMVLGKSLKQWINEFPMIYDMIQGREVFWTNPLYAGFQEAVKSLSLNQRDVEEAEERLKRFAPYIEKAFPETQERGGIIESPILRIPHMKKYLEGVLGQVMPGELILKCDNNLAISGSIKARGGIYEVLKHAEDLALGAGMISIGDNYSVFDSKEFMGFFSNYSIAVGSTGNLGLSIGIMSAKLGFRVTVHMSSDAKQWKKDLLRSKGVSVVEYASDYSRAVEEGRRQSQSQPNSYFVDDENSKNLFLGYAVAASRLKKQLEDLNIFVDKDHPLFVYLPCGVGGGPGGVAFGLKLLFQDSVHCFFAEPTHSPCMLLGCMTGKHNGVSVQDFGIDNITAADGLAVGRASGFVGRILEKLLSGVYTVEDNLLYMLLWALADTEGIYLEPSALAGIPGMVKILETCEGREYLSKNNLLDKMKNANHIAWATGGSMVPREEMEKYYQKGKTIVSSVL